MCENMVAAVLHSVMEILRLCEEKRIVHGNVTPEAFRLRTKKTDPFKMDRLCFAPAGWLKTTNFEHSRYLLRTLFSAFRRQAEMFCSLDRWRSIWESSGSLGSSE